MNQAATNISAMPNTPPDHGPIGDGARVSNRKDGSIQSLFIAEESPLLRYAFGLTGRRAIAEELVQEVFLQLHTHWETVENPKAWLYRSVRNRAYNHHRDNKREVFTDKIQEPQAEKSESPENVLQRMEASGFLRMLVSELSKDDRQLVELKYFEDLKYRDIAEQTGLSVGNVGYRLHHILKELATKLKQLGIEGGSGI